MGTEQQIRERRAALHRRRWFWAPLDAAALGAFVWSAIALRANDPVNELILLSYAVVSAAGPLVLDGADDLQRLRALKQFALGASFAVLWMLVDVVWQLASASYHGKPASTALAVLAIAWISASLLDRWRTTDES
jgi:hypothetical protein